MPSIPPYVVISREHFIRATRADREWMIRGALMQWRNTASVLAEARLCLQEATNRAASPDCVVVNSYRDSVVVLEARLRSVASVRDNYRRWN